MNWNIEIPEFVQCDYTKILDTAIPFAKDLIGNHGEFYPFGAVINAKGLFEFINTKTNDEHPSSKEILSLLQKGLQNGLDQGEYRATGICLNIASFTNDEGGICDAIQMIVQHKKGDTISFFFPYRHHSGQVTWGEPFFRK